MGVTTLSFGGCRGCGAFRVGIPSLVPFVTGRAFGEGGMERPSCGGPLLPGRAPGIGGRRRGAGDDMFGGGCGEDVLVKGCIYGLVISVARKVSAALARVGSSCSDGEQWWWVGGLLCARQSDCRVDHESPALSWAGLGMSGGEVGGGGVGSKGWASSVPTRWVAAVSRRVSACFGHCKTQRSTVGWQARVVKMEAGRD